MRGFKIPSPSPVRILAREAVATSCGNERFRKVAGWDVLENSVSRVPRCSAARCRRDFLRRGVAATSPRLRLTHVPDHLAYCSSSDVRGIGLTFPQVDCGGQIKSGIGFAGHSLTIDEDSKGRKKIQRYLLRYLLSGQFSKRSDAENSIQRADPLSRVHTFARFLRSVSNRLASPSTGSQRPCAFGRSFFARPRFLRPASLIPFRQVSASPSQYGHKLPSAPPNAKKRLAE